MDRKIKCRGCGVNLGDFEGHVITERMPRMAGFWMPSGDLALYCNKCYKARTKRYKASTSSKKDPITPKSDRSKDKQDERLFEELKKWRLQKAKSKRLPAYMIFRDQTLQEISTALIRDKYDLKMISGIAKAKLKMYGDELMEIIRKNSV